MSKKHSVPLGADYATAIGRAAYIFARTEWQAVWCCEQINPGCISKLSDLTAGKVADALNKAAKEAPDECRPALKRAGKHFKWLVKIRNAILHGKPCTAPDGEQRLSYNGRIWSIEKLDQAADMFAECGGRLNKIFYAYLYKKDEGKIDHIGHKNE